MTEQIQVDGHEIPAYLYDGYQVHRAALSRGLHVLALPRQVLLAGRNRTVPSEVSFTHGVPEASTVSAVTYAQDSRLRRAMLERAGVPVPRGATFTWNGLGAAVRWVHEIGYPVSVKEVVGENPARAIRGVRSEEQVRAAFQELRIRQPEDRSPGSNPLIAGYATTRLGYVLDDEGNEVAPLRTRFLVEKELDGHTVRALVCGGRIIAAVRLDTDTHEGVADVTDELHPEFSIMLIRAAEAIPGLAMATVDAVTEDYRREPGGQAAVVEVAERPRAETYIGASGGIGERIGDALLQFQATRAGVDLPAPQSQVRAEVRIEGLRNAAAVAREFPAIATDYDVALTVSDQDDVDGELITTCSGPPSGLAILMELLMSGDLLSDRAACVEYTMDGSDD